MVPLLIPRRKDWPCWRQDRIILPTLMRTVPGKPPEGSGAVCPLHDFVILSVAVFQA